MGIPGWHSGSVTGILTFLSVFSCFYNPINSNAVVTLEIVI